MSKTKFHASQFTPTQFSTSEDKAKFANHVVRFVTTGYRRSLFTKAFYNRLSMCFGHIAHYNQAGFYAAWFEDRESQLRFLQKVARWRSYGDPAFTFSDVERALHSWLAESGLIAEMQFQVLNERDAAERAELARLTAKYRPNA